MIALLIYDRVIVQSVRIYKVDARRRPLLQSKSAAPKRSATLMARYTVRHRKEGGV